MSETEIIFWAKQNECVKMKGEKKERKKHQASESEELFTQDGVGRDGICLLLSILIIQPFVISVIRFHRTSRREDEAKTAPDLNLGKQ